MSSERLNRYLARRGVSSRRGADELIAAGRVTVNGTPAVVGSVVDAETDSVSVDGRDIAAPPAPVTFMVNKPAGVVSTRRDPQHRRTVMDLAEPVRGLVPVGRLDTDSRGLLLLSTDGELTHRLTHPRFGVTKTYQVVVTPAPVAAQIAAMRDGVDLDDGPARAVDARIIEHARDDVIEVTMGEGRKREVRRLCAAVGLQVKDLRRVAFGPLQLVGVSEGAARPLNRGELEALYTVVGLPVPPPTGQTRRR